jgi:4-hydroxythreonine-4-phosphate dehydrogenase
LLKIGYTLGDLAGIGPEIFYDFRSKKSKYLDLLVDYEILLIDDQESVNFVQKNIQIGKASALAGKHAFRTLEKANFMALKGEIDYLVTGPVSKESLALASYPYKGQTELLADLNKLQANQVEMFFVLNSPQGQYRCVLGTRHTAIKKVSDTLKDRLETVLENSVNALNRIWKLKKPRIAIAGLNPHAGENGLIGSEELDFIQPLISSFRSRYPEIPIEGPYPPDYLFAKMAQNYLNSKAPDFDLYVAAYHDQVLPVIKGIGALKSVNLTVGLPYIRASVDHGTAYDIAGLGIAKSESLLACTELCINLGNKVNC